MTLYTDSETGLIYSYNNGVLKVLHPSTEEFVELTMSMGKLVAKINNGTFIGYRRKDL